MDFVLKNAKSLIAAAVTLLTSIQVALPDGLTGQEILGAIIGGLVALGAVFGVQNKGQADAQAVVDQVRALVPESAKDAIDEVVPAARGVLKSVS